MSSLTIAAVGDVFLNRPDPADAFAKVTPILRAADVLFGNCEGVYTDTPRSVPTASGFRLISRRANAAALGSAGFQILSCANNHTVDSGHEGLLETLALLEEQRILAPGAGPDLEQARRPVTLRRAGARIVVLAYSCVYPAGYEARDRTPGIAAMRVHTHYFVHPEAFGRVEPGADPSIHTTPFPEDFELLIQSVGAARAEADILIVSFHWGKSTKPAQLMNYERAFGHAAIEAGADVVFGHHHHLLRGIEFHRGKPIFYGLGHFAFDMPGLESALSARQLEKLRAHGEYAIYPRDGYPLLPFHPDSRMTMIGLCWAGAAGLEVGFIPCLINSDNQPVPLPLDSADGACVLEYMSAITKEAGLATHYRGSGRTIGGYEVAMALPMPAHALEPRGEADQASTAASRPSVSPT